MPDWVVPAIVALLALIIAYPLLRAAVTDRKVVDPQYHLQRAQKAIARGNKALAVVREAVDELEYRLDMYEKTVSTAVEWEERVKKSHERR